MKTEKKNKKLAPIVLKSSIIMTFLIGFILNIVQLIIYFDFSHEIGKELIMLVAGTYIVYFYFLSTINALTIGAFIIDYIGDKLNGN